MTKYYIYAENAKKPIRKMKRENEAIMFASDFKNLANYGCMSVIMEADNGSKYTWDHEAGSWRATGGNVIGSND